MRDNFYFRHIVQPDMLYHAKIEDGRYKVTWKDKRGIEGSSYYNFDSVEKIIDNGMWIIEII